MSLRSPKPSPSGRAAPAPRCARCGAPQAASHAPFCSAGCRDRDLLDWLGERHVIPGTPLLDNPEADA